MNKQITENEARAGDGEEAGDSANGMTCSSCERAQLVESRISTVFRSGDEWAVIRNIPAMVCPNCREELIDDATAVQLDMMRANGFALDDAPETMTVPVFAYPDGGASHS